MIPLILIGGAAPEKIFGLEDHSTVIAADSGYDTALSLGLEPDVFVGDGDSTSRRRELEEKGTIFAPVAKDDTDFTMAVKMTEGDYDLIGGGEGRLDHTLGIFSTFIETRAPRHWMTREDELWSGRHFEITCEPDTLISFFPVNLMKTSAVTTDGLEWNLEGREISLGFFSLSNRTRKSTVRIDATEPIFIRLPLSVKPGEYTIAVC